MLSDECYLGKHDHCVLHEFCDCLCHVQLADDELELLVADNREKTD